MLCLIRCAFKIMLVLRSQCSLAMCWGYAAAESRGCRVGLPQHRRSLMHCVLISRTTECAIFIFIFIWCSGSWKAEPQNVLYLVLVLVAVEKMTAKSKSQAPYSFAPCSVIIIRVLQACLVFLFLNWPYHLLGRQEGHYAMKSTCYIPDKLESLRVLD